MNVKIDKGSREVLRKIIDSNDVNFGFLTKLAGLDPAKDFRFGSFRDVDFRDADIRGFDFSGADLIGAVKNGRTLIDSTTLFDGAQIAWIEADSADIIQKMLSIQNTTSSTQRKKLLVELVEQYQSAKHIHQFLITSIIKSKSIEAFFDFANAISSFDGQHANLVIMEELKSLVERKGSGAPKGRRKLAQTPYGVDLILRLLDDAINPVLREVAGKVFGEKGPISRSTILVAIGDITPNLI